MFLFCRCKKRMFCPRSAISKKTLFSFFRPGTLKSPLLPGFFLKCRHQKREGPMRSDNPLLATENITAQICRRNLLFSEHRFSFKCLFSCLQKLVISHPFTSLCQFCSYPIILLVFPQAFFYRLRADNCQSGYLQSTFLLTHSFNSPLIGTLIFSFNTQSNSLHTSVRRRILQGPVYHLSAVLRFSSPHPEGSEGLRKTYFHICPCSWETWKCLRPAALPQNG